jgi:hypothetical protein
LIRYKISFILLFSLFTLHGKAEVEIDFRHIDETTYRLFLEKKWDSLIIVGKQALKNDIDYYFLRMRLGIAFYSETKYIPASVHFQKATVFNSLEPDAWEYLYSCYILANRSEQAYALVKDMPSGLQKKYRPEKKFLEMITLEGGKIYSSHNSTINDLDIRNAGSYGAAYGEQDLYRNSYYGHLGMLLNIAAGANLEVGYSYLDFSKIKHFQYLQYENLLDSTVNYWYGYSNYYNSSPSLYSRSIPYDVKQQEFHLGSDILLGDGFSLQPAFHLIKVSYKNIVTEFTRTNLTDTIYYDSITPELVTVHVTKENFNFVQKDTNFYNYVIALGISKTFSLYTLSLNGSYSNLNNKKQTQIGGSFTVYPLGNLDLYSISRVTGFIQKKDKRLILSQTAGGRVWKRFWLEGNFIWGDLTNTNTGNGSIVYNNVGKIDYRLEGNLIWPCSKHLEFSLNYQYFQKKSATYYTAFSEGPPSVKTSSLTLDKKYHTNTFIIGIKWKL